MKKTIFSILFLSNFYTHGTRSYYKRKEIKQELSKKERLVDYQETRLKRQSSSRSQEKNKRRREIEEGINFYVTCLKNKTVAQEELDH